MPFPGCFPRPPGTPADEDPGEPADLPRDVAYEWRREQFGRVGGGVFDELDADLLAATGADYRLAEAMLGHGCPPATVLYILI